MKIKKRILSLLMKTQKFSKTDNVYLGTQGFFISVNYTIVFVLGLLTAMAFARFVPKEIYAHYQYLLSIMSLLGIFSLRGISASLTRSTARGFEGSFNLAIKKKFVWSLIGSAVALVLSGYYILKGNDVLAIGSAFIALLIPFMETADTYTAYFEGKKNFKHLAKLNIFYQFAYTTVVLIIIYFYPQLLPLFLGYAVIAILVKWFFNYSIIKKVKGKKVDATMVKYGKHLSLMGVITTIAKHLNKILIFHYVGAIQLAIYAFADIPQKQATAFLANLRSIAYPKLAEKNKDIQIKVWIRKLLLVTVFVSVGVALYILISPYLYRIFFPTYMEAVKYSRMLFLLVLFFPLSFLPLIFQAKKMQKELYQWNTLTAIAEIILLFSLIPLYGVWGLIYAQLISKTISSIFSIYLFKKSFAK
ncbi:oligosaccharide flippase family protein [Patescibacteria group bacterium]